MSAIPKSWSPLLSITAVFALGLSTLLACTGDEDTTDSTDGGASGSSAAAAAGAADVVQSDAAAELAPLTITPELAYIGDTITINADGLPADSAVTFMMYTQAGSYETNIDLGSIEFLRPSYTNIRTTLGEATTDSQGRVTAEFTVPEDYATTSKDVFAVVDGEDVAKGGVYVQRVASIDVTEGPVGTPITIDVKGLGSSGFRSTVAVRWDNQYMGFMSSTTTGGSATAVIRAAGPVGVHYIDIGPASAAVPYLNPQQTPRKITIPTFRFAFNVTADEGVTPASVEWPEAQLVNMSPSALALSPKWGELASSSDVSATMTPVSGPVLSQTTLAVSGLAANSSADIVWRTVTGSDVTGWAGEDESLATISADASGNATLSVDVPDGLGGWHTLGVIQDGEVVAEAPYFVERTLVGVNPETVRSGEPFTVQIKGVGWTELDNGVAIVYDNHYVGYACGFGSGGDVTVELVATGGPGTHLIELYPMIYNRGFSQRHYWNYEVPMLTFAQDHPGLALGYRLPVFRFAVTVE